MTSLTRFAVAACGRLYIIVIVHSLWLTGALIGGVVFGIGPATIAVRGALREGTAEFSGRAAAREYVRRYRAAFLRAVPSWLALQLGGSAIVIATVIGAIPPGGAGLVIRAALLSGAIVVAICITTWSSAADVIDLPVSPLTSIRTVTLYAIARFPLTLVTLGAYAVAFLAVMQIPALVLVVGPALIVCALDPLESPRSMRQPTIVVRD